MELLVATSFQWLHIFLKGHKGFNLIYHSVLSDSTVAIGVPQGSFWALYISHHMLMTSHMLWHLASNVYRYTDDTLMFQIFLP